MKCLGPVRRKRQHSITQKIARMVSHDFLAASSLLTRYVAKEIENLRQESQALKNIRQSLGSDEFPRKVFDKVFKDDINRLRSMDDMWKTRLRPDALDFDALSQAASNVIPSVARQDQRTWTDAENFAVFCDR